MNNNLFLQDILPASEDKIQIILMMVSLSLVSCITAILFPTYILKVIIIACLVLGLIIFKIRILQFMLLLTFLPMLFPIISQDLASLVISGLILFGLALLGGRVAFGQERLEHNKIFIAVVLLYFFFSFNTIISTFCNSSISAFTISESIRYFFYAGMLIVLYYFMTSTQIIRNLILTAIAASIAIATSSYYLAFTLGIRDLLLFGGIGMHGIHIGNTNANTIATVIANSMPILLAYWIFGIDKKKRYFCLFLCVYLFIIWLPLNSRSSYLFIFGALITLLMFHPRRWKYLSVISGLLLACYVVVASGIFPLLKVFLRLEKGLTNRGDLWTAAYRMFSESPLVGKGPDYFDKFKFYYMDPGYGRLTSGYNFGLSPHNVLLMRAVDMGIFAVIAQVLLWVLPIVVFIKNSKLIKFSQYYYIYLASGAILVGMVLRSIFEVGNNVFSAVALIIVIRMPELIKKND
jgi:O-antigen ligase